MNPKGYRKDVVGILNESDQTDKKNAMQHVEAVALWCVYLQV